MFEDHSVVRSRLVGRSSDRETRLRQSVAGWLGAALILGGAFGALGCRGSSTPPPDTPPVTAASEPASGAEEAAPTEAAPTPAPSLDPLTQLRWQALAKGDGSASPPPSETAAPSDSPAGRETGPMHSEKAGLRDYWQGQVNDARDPYESARATHRQECPELPPGQKRAPEDQSYCDDLEKAERLAKARYEAARQGAARHGFSLQ